MKSIHFRYSKNSFSEIGRYHGFNRPSNISFNLVKSSTTLFSYEIFRSSDLNHLHLDITQIKTSDFVYVKGDSSFLKRLMKTK